MIKPLQTSKMHGEYTRFEVEDTLTGVIRTYAPAPNELTQEGLVSFGSDDPKWHSFNRCLMSRRFLTEDELAWGEIIPSNSNPDDPWCSNFVASEVNDAYHSDITKQDDGANFYIQATKSWTFRQGIVGDFNMVVSGHMESTEEVPANSGPLKDHSSLTTLDPVTGDTEYDNWKLYPTSIAPLPFLPTNPTGTITLAATDILTVSHSIRIYLPKYIPGVLFNEIVIGGNTHTLFARPYLPAYDALKLTNVPITKMSYCNSSEMTGGLVSGLRQTIRDGGFDELGTPFITGDGDYTNSERVKISEDGEPDKFTNAIQHQLVLEPSSGQGYIGHFLLNGCGAWYEVEVDPPIPKRAVDRLSLTFMFTWG